MQARRTEAETFRAAPSGRRILAADGCASSLSNPAACCFCAVSAPGGPRGVAVAMFGHTGLGMLICRNEHGTRAHIHARSEILIQTISAFVDDNGSSFLTIVVGNQIAESVRSVRQLINSGRRQIDQFCGHRLDDAVRMLSLT
jgi:hypothetical protein